MDGFNSNFISHMLSEDDMGRISAGEASRRRVGTLCCAPNIHIGPAVILGMGVCAAPVLSFS